MGSNLIAGGRWRNIQQLAVEMRGIRQLRFQPGLGMNSKSVLSKQECHACVTASIHCMKAETYNHNVFDMWLYADSSYCSTIICGTTRRKQSMPNCWSTFQKVSRRKKCVPNCCELVPKRTPKLVKNILSGSEWTCLHPTLNRKVFNVHATSYPHCIETYASATPSIDTISSRWTHQDQKHRPNNSSQPTCDPGDILNIFTIVFNWLLFLA